MSKKVKFEDRLPDLIKNIANTPELYLHQVKIETDSGLVIEADLDFYRDASFLDQRALSEQSTGMWLPLTRISSSQL